MSSTKKDNVKESTTNQFKETTDKYLEQQRQQYKDTASNISQTTDKINQNVNKFQEDNKRIFEKNADIFRNSQEQINRTIQSISNNYVELQKNILNTYQSAFSRFVDDVSKSNWNNFRIPERYADIYNKTNQNITDHTINCTQKINDFVLGSTETFSKSVEIGQKYYKDPVQNYFNFVNKIREFYYT